MDSSAKIIAFAATTDANRARDFYRDTLGLPLAHEDGFALVFDSGGTMLRVQKVPSLVPAGHTVLGWQVDDIAAAIAGLVSKGVVFERFPGLAQDADGVWTSPVGGRIAWFKDPDGNTLSLTQF